MERNEGNEKQNIWISVEAIGNNIDLLTEILLRLPVKAVVRAKCVSKQWLSIISDPQFCVSHTRHHHSPFPTPTALLLNDFKPRQELKFETVPLSHEVPLFDYLNNAPEWARINQSCNGFLLCSSKSYSTATTTEHGLVPECIYHICNPTTKHFNTLSFPTREFKDSLVSVNLAFDPLKSNHYKLICVHKEKNTDRCQIYMYLSETDSWRCLGINFTPPNQIDFVAAVFCNGVVHWYGDETSIYFDVDRECFNIMPMPNLPHCGYYHYPMLKYFEESRGHLHLIVTECFSESPLQFDVFEMAPNYSGWFVRYHVNLDAIKIAFPNLVWCRNRYHPFSVSHIIQAQKEEESIIMVFVDNKTMSYNFHNGTVKKLCDLEPRGFSFIGITPFNTLRYSLLCED